MNKGTAIPSQKKNPRSLVVAMGIFLCPLFSLSQSDDVVVPESGYKVRAEIVKGDTVPVIDLNTVVVETEYAWKSNKQRERYMRMRSDVRVVYPYAILAAAKLEEYDLILAKMPNEQMKKAYLRVCEKDLKNEFEDELKNMSIGQGRILMKLIDRESGKTTYEIVKQMRGGFQAMMWQAVARLFGNDMKDGYDAETDDKALEFAIKQIEAGNQKY